jgi:hypothetical protein
MPEAKEGSIMLAYIIIGLVVASISLMVIQFGAYYRSQNK